MIVKCLFIVFPFLFVYAHAQNRIEPRNPLEIYREHQKSIQEAKKSVVSIRALSVQNRDDCKVGSGFVYDADGFVLTRCYVIEDTDSIVVTLSNGKSYPAWIMREDNLARIAILKLDAHDLVPVRIGESASLELNSQVIVLGNSMGVFPSLTFGTYLGKRRDGLLKIEIMIPPGNSGSPVLDNTGSVVGMLMGIQRKDQARQSTERELSVVLPIERVKDIIDAEIKDIASQKGWVGISVRDLTGAQEGKGVRVTSVMPDGPAHKAGICKGDTIIAFEGQPISSTKALKEAFNNMQIQQDVRFTLLKNSLERTESVRIIGNPWSRD